MNIKQVGASRTLYHGTSGNNLAAILSEGLVPGKKRTWLGTRFYVGERGESIYLAEDVDKAKYFAVESLCWDATEVLLLEVDAEGLDIIKDEFESGSWRVGKILPERLLRFSRFRIAPETEERPLRTSDDLEFIERVELHHQR